MNPWEFREASHNSRRTGMVPYSDRNNSITYNLVDEIEG